VEDLLDEPLWRLDAVLEDETQVSTVLSAKRSGGCRADGAD